MEHLSIFLFFIFFLRDRGSKYIFKVLIFLQAAFSNKKAVHVSLNVCDYKKTKKEVMISSVAVEGIWMWDVERSGKVERLLALASRNQQFLSHDLYAGVVRQLQVVDAGHDWGEEVVWVLCRLKRLPHDRQRGIQAPETWETRATPGWVYRNTQAFTLHAIISSVQFIFFYF